MLKTRRVPSTIKGIFLTISYMLHRMAKNSSSLSNKLTPNLRLFLFFKKKFAPALLCLFCLAPVLQRIVLDSTSDVTKPKERRAGTPQPTWAE